ncbi:MAG TPA: histidinol-phosphate transaminase [Acidimicrobiales bacterium]|nr:histidinol-phosphate transaminase [Acidimicrobiales bacterium]
MPRPAIADLPSYRPGRSVEGSAKLSSNEQPFDPLPSVRAALADAGARINRYPDHHATAVREAVAARLHVPAECIAVGCGSVGLLQQLCLAYAGPGDEVAFGWRSFEAYPIMTTIAGAEAVTAPLVRDTIDVGALRITERTKLVLLANPNNPTGTALDDSGLTAFLGDVPPTCLVVLDEAYREFVTRDDVVDGLARVKAHPNVVVLRTFSKAYGLAGLRIGYMVADPEVVAVVDKVLIPFAVNAVAQAAALASLAADDELHERVAAVVAERTRVRRALFELGYATPDSQANFVWMPTVDVPGVVTRPFPEGMRVTIGTPEENDRFLAGLPPADDPTHASRVAAVLDRIDGVRARLPRLADTPRRGLTDPDPGGTERWDEGQAWAHIGEFGRYWLVELDKVLASDGAPFGRVKSDPARVRWIDGHRHDERRAHLTAAMRALDRLAHVVSSLSPEDWRRHGVHSKLGAMDVPRILDEFLVGHYEEHADQLEKLDAG